MISGKVFFVGISEWNDDVEKMIEEYDLGGILLSPRVLGDPVQFYRAMDFLSGRDILVSSDHEGGQMETVPYIPPLPGNMVLGRADPSETEEITRDIARILNMYGFNTIFAPVLDLHFPGSSAVIGTRSFSSDPKIAAEHGVAAIRGYVSGGIVPCAKHFPGHGRAVHDSHEEDVVIDATMEDIWETDLLPFRRAVDAGVPMIMTAHITVPSVDDLPATLSKFFIGEILRRRMGYEGIVISDAVEMRAIRDRFSPDEIVRKFFEAGGDMIIIADSSNLPEFHDALHKALEDFEVRKKVEEASVKISDLARRSKKGRLLSRIFRVSSGAPELKAGKVPKKIFLVVPRGKNLSQADTSASHYDVIVNSLSKIFEIEGVERYEIADGPQSARGDVVVDIVVDAFRSRRALENHRKLSDGRRVVYVIARDPKDAELLEGEKVVTFSSNPVVVCEALRKLL